MSRSPWVRRGSTGRIDVGGPPHPPELILPHPVVIVPVPVGVAVPAPIYLHVPPGHEKHRENTGRSTAVRTTRVAGPVYFVRHAWYNDVYVLGYRAKNGAGTKGHGNGHGGGEGHGANKNHGHGENG